MTLETGATHFGSSAVPFPSDGHVHCSDGYRNKIKNSNNADNAGNPIRSCRNPPRSRIVDAGSMETGMRFILLLAALLLPMRAASAAPQVFPSSAGALAVETIAGGLVHPWSLAFLPDGRMLVTERPGRMRIVTRGRQVVAAACRRAEGVRVKPGRPARRDARPRFRAEQARSTSATPSPSGGGGRTAVAARDWLTAGRRAWTTSR